MWEYFDFRNELNLETLANSSLHLFREFENLLCRCISQVDNDVCVFFENRSITNS